MTFRLYYAFIVLSNARLTTGLWILYLLHRGFSLLEIGLVESVFHLTVLAAEVPTGYLADRLGRRRSLALGLLSGMAGTLLILWAPSLPWLFPAFVFSALPERLGYGWAFLPSVLLLGLAPWGLGWEARKRAAVEAGSTVPAKD